METASNNGDNYKMSPITTKCSGKGELPQPIKGNVFGRKLPVEAEEFSTYLKMYIAG
jgi:hypothetical protein